MNLDKTGNYRVNVKAYIPSTLTQCTDAWRNGRVNKVATVMVRAEFANGGIKTATLEIDETNRDSWQDITLDFAVEEGDALNYILLYAYVETNSETDTSRYGEVFFDEVKLYSVDATLTYAKENGDVISEQTYFPGSEITLPGKDVVGFEPVYEISGKQYFAGDKYVTDAKTGDLTITAKSLDAPKTLELAQVRTSGVQGLRYAAFITNEKRETADEYGFIVGLASVYSDATELTFDTSKKYVHGIAYNKSTGVDLVYSYSGNQFGSMSEGEGIYFTACLIGIPSEQYETDIIGRPYIKMNGFTFYGKPITRNIKEVADAAGVELE